MAKVSKGIPGLVPFYRFVFLFLIFSFFVLKIKFQRQSMADIIEAILKGIAMGLLLVISVGPVVFTIIKQSINNGKGGGFSFVIGVWISDFILVILSNLFSELVTMVMDFKTQIGVAGSVFLMGMG